MDNYSIISRGKTFHPRKFRPKNIIFNDSEYEENREQIINASPMLRNMNQKLEIIIQFLVFTFITIWFIIIFSF